MVSELMPYTETRRDRLEQELAAEANKRELDYRYNNGITVIAYWLMKENVCLIFVHDERTNHGNEFVVPNDEVGEWFHHPYANPGAEVITYQQRQNGEQV